MKILHNTNLKLLITSVTVCVLGMLASTAHAAGGHRELLLKGKKSLVAKNYSDAESKFYRAYRWAKKELGDKIDPDYVVSYCQALVLTNNLRTAGGICKEAVKLAKGRLAKKAAKYNKLAQKAILIKKSVDRAKWADRYLRNGQFVQAVTAFNKAIKIYPHAAYYVGLCDALKGLKKMGPAMNACKKALAIKGTAADTTRAKKIMGQLKTAKALAFTPKQAKAATMILDATTKLQFIRPKKNYRSRRRRHGARKSSTELDKHLDTFRACIAATDAAIASGLKPTQKVEVMSVKGLKTSMVRHVVNGRSLGWKHYATVSAVASLCKSKNSGVQINVVRSALQISAKEMVGAEKLDKADTLNKVQIIVAVQSVKKCIAAVDLIIASKLDPNTIIDTVHKGKVKLKNAKRKICLRLEAQRVALLTKYKVAIKAALDAKLAPYKKVLRGDKYKTFYNFSMYDRYVYTKKKRLLKTPRAFKRASVWFQEMTYTHNCRVRVCWRLRRFQFKGNRLRRTTEKTGTGNTVPTSKYR
jgi:hypothetical protein